MKNDTLKSLAIGAFVSKRPLVSAPETASLKSVHKAMVDNDISHIPLLNSTGQVVGVLGEREVRSFYLAPNFSDILANTIMSTTFSTFTAETPLSIVARKMVEQNQCVVVIDSGAASPLGVFTVSDALFALDFVLQNHI